MIHLSLQILPFLLFILCLLVRIGDELAHLDDVVGLLLQIVFILRVRALELTLLVPDDIKSLILLLLHLRQVIVVALQLSEDDVLLELA